MPEELPTPGQVATNEAARQAVMLVFGVVSALIVMHLQSKMVKKIMPGGAMPGSAAAADAERTARMEDARRMERIWSKIGAKVGGLSMWAWAQADKARASYEKDRA